MQATWGEGEVHFREEVRAFCDTELPAETREIVVSGRPLEKRHYVDWQKRLHGRGWIAGHWPREFGGQDWTPAQSFIFQEETSRAGAPWLLPFGVNYVGPVIYTYGSPEQRERHLPGILTSDVFWCQGYSEPGAGSDLARLSTRAVRDGDSYVVNGSKIWTTMAHWADWIFCLVRTDAEARPQGGISFLLIDMTTPGITVRPIRSIDGQHHLNQVFFEDVRVPAGNLVGEENRGWTYAKFLLGHERVLAAEVGKAGRYLDRARRIATQRPAPNGSLADDPRWRDRYARLKLRATTLEWTTLRLLDRVMSGEADGVGASTLNIRGSELIQDISEFTVDTLGAEALGAHPASPRPNGGDANAERFDASGLTGEFLYNRATTIFGGSNEIQRGIIARHGLGL